MPSQSTPRRPRKHDWGGELSLTDAFTDAFLCSPVRRVLLHNIAGIPPAPPDKDQTGPKKPDLGTGQPHLPTGGSGIPDKILVWQGTGAGVVTGLPVPALVPAVAREEASAAVETKQHSSVPTKSKQDDVQAKERGVDDKASGPGGVANNGFSPRRIYSPATPLKRVVSDGHWMKDKPKATPHTSDAVQQVKLKGKEKVVPAPPSSNGPEQARPKGKEKAVSSPPPSKAPKQAGQRAKEGPAATSRPSEAPEQARPKGKERPVVTPPPSNDPGQTKQSVKENSVSAPQSSDAPEQAKQRATGKAVSNPRPSKASEQARAKVKERATSTPRSSEAPNQARQIAEEIAAQTTRTPEAPKQAKTRARETVISNPRPSEASEQARPKGKENAVAAPPSPEDAEPTKRKAKGKAVSTLRPTEAPEQAKSKAKNEAVLAPEGEENQAAGSSPTRPSVAKGSRTRRRRDNDGYGVGVDSTPEKPHPDTRTPPPEQESGRLPRRTGGNRIDEWLAAQRAPSPSPQADLRIGGNAKAPSGDPDAGPNLPRRNVRQAHIDRRLRNPEPRPSRSPAGSQADQAEIAPETHIPQNQRSPDAGRRREQNDERTSPPPSSQLPANWIEAWLHNTPDPFVDDTVDPAEPNPLSAVRESAEKSMSEGGPASPEAFNDNRADGGPTKTHSSNRKRRKQPAGAAASHAEKLCETSSPPIPEQDEKLSTAEETVVSTIQSPPPLSITPGLKRRVARKHSPKKGRRKSPPRVRELTEPGITGPHHVGKSTLPAEPHAVAKPAGALDAVSQWLFQTSESYLSSAHGSEDEPARTPQTANPPRATGPIDAEPIADHSPSGPSALSVAPGEDEGTFQAATAPEEDACNSQVEDRGNGLTRRLTTHAELMSVLSLPDTTSVKQRRKIRARKDTVTSSGLESIMAEFAADERMYSRVLHTLVEGVIPVLLSCVLSGSDTAAAAWLYGDSAQNPNNTNVARPIIDIGVCLERLKDLHKRVPLQDPTKLLQWAQAAHTAYEEYISCWWLAFEDVVINLAPVESEEEQEQMDRYQGVKRRPDDAGMPQDENGDVIDENGEKVDVAYLLSVPLHRTKGLKKMIEAIHAISPSPLAAELKEKWSRVWKDGENKVQKEENRRQGEKVAAIDTSRVKDLRTLAPMGPPDIDLTRSVLLHGVFSMQFCHSSGAILHSQVKLYLRENAPESGKEGGDLLICALEESESFLLFPPIDKTMCSAKASVEQGELIVMVRGTSTSGSGWKENFLFITDCCQQCLEWPERLGTKPCPPTLKRHDPFLDSPSGTLVLASHTPPAPASVTMELVPRSARLKPKGPRLLEYIAGQDTAEPVAAEAPPPDPRQDRGGPGSGLRRANAKRHSRSPATIDASGSQGDDAEAQSAAAPDGSVLTVSEAGLVPSERGSSLDAVLAWGTDEEESESVLTASAVTFAPSGRAPSPGVVPAQGGGGEAQGSDAAGRGGSEVSAVAERAPSSSGRLPDPAADTSLSQKKGGLLLPAAAELRAWQLSTVGATGGARRRGSSPLKHEYAPSSASEGDSETGSEGSSESVLGPGDHSPLAEEGRADPPQEEVALEAGDAPTPLVPMGPHCQRGEGPPPGSAGSVANATLTPSESASQAPYRGVPHSRAMAPFRVIATVLTWKEDAGGPPSWDQLCEHACVVVTAGLVEAARPVETRSEQAAAAAAATTTMTTATTEAAVTTTETMEAAATTTEAAEAAGQQDGSLPAAADANKKNPLVVSQVLTPLSCVEPGTALDVFVRSPLAARTELAGVAEITYRCRTAREAGMLRHALMVAQARNPTYDALRRARSIHDPGFLSSLKARRRRAPPRSFASRTWRRLLGGARRTTAVPATAPTASSSSSLRRANSISATSIAASPPSVLVSESSVGTRRSMLSAMRLFEHGGRAFNIARSSISRRASSSSTTIPEEDEYDEDADDDKALAAIAEEDDDEATATAEGAAIVYMSEVKCRLHLRAAASGNWEDMGSARLTIRRPGAEHHAPPNHMHVILTRKAAWQAAAAASSPLLNACLGPESFTLTGRKGIAVQLFEEHGPDQELVHAGAVGGVGMNQRVYMIQMKTEAQAMRALQLLKPWD